MSRCFPFPPPGYEKKITIDDTGLLKEEKRKDKRYKKDKEKKDRDKDRSREKNREKKERKEKRKDKDRNRKDKQQDKISNEKRIGGQGCSGAENLGPKSLQNNGIRDYKYVQELARRIGDADSAAGSQMVQKIDAAKKRKAEQWAVPAENTNGNHTEEKEKPKDKMRDGRRVNGYRNNFETRCPENANENFFGMDPERSDAISASKENNLEQHLDGKDKKKNKESAKSDKQKDRHQEKTRMPIDENWEKEKKQEEKAKEVNDQSNGHLKLKETSVRLKESGKDSVDSCNFKPPGLLKRSGNSSVGEGNVGKRKDPELNGFLHGE
ncbi:putative DNA binding protein [Tripterygium wilfordii]|uniref:Putative DNA binding protein n=1 Tax=Tripterygium wilfordii TaxID=458696 RepID=A0A7J7DIU3_TRIWF|nr:putative DNA binding protein [Tripterygium wilfordii]